MRIRIRLFTLYDADPDEDPDPNFQKGSKPWKSALKDTHTVTTKIYTKKSGVPIGAE